ncbi:MAG: DUF4886 domain-containing protein [Clostridia bacterium]|nr:DUF4886 domain-containing protein [Clostridia bacterium]
MKKITSIVLCICLIMTLLCGCSKQDVTESNYSDDVIVEEIIIDETEEDSTMQSSNTETPDVPSVDSSSADNSSVDNPSQNTSSKADPASCSHSYDGGKVEQKAELFKAGTKKYTCTKCDDSYTSSYPVEKIKLLSISNSYGQDSFMKMDEICVQAGITDIDIAVLYYPGCSLDTHFEKINGTHENGYTLYRYTDETGTWNNPQYDAYDTDITEFLNENSDWDIIALQQSSGGSGNSGSFANLDNIISYVSEKCPNAKLLWNMTWAYPNGSKYLDSYGDTNTMYNSIISCANDIIAPKVKAGALHSIVPVGTAVMNARTSSLESTVHRDESHLSEDFGRYIAALTWFCHLTGQSPYDTAFAANSYILSDKMDVILESTKNALENPYKITQSIYTE